MKQDLHTFAVIGAAMEVHRELGCGFLEMVYQSAMALELRSRGVPFRAEVPLPVSYKGNLLNCAYRTDFVCFDDLVVELKAVSGLVSGHLAQLMNELKATGFRRGLLINFGAPSLQVKRVVCGPQKNTRLDEDIDLQGGNL